jgi:hypothetical protein
VAVPRATPTGEAGFRGDVEFGSVPAGVLPSGPVRGGVTLGPVPPGPVTFGPVTFGPVTLGPVGEVLAGVGCVPLPSGELPFPGSEGFGVMMFGRLGASVREVRSIPGLRAGGVVPLLDVSVPKGDHGLRPPAGAAERGPELIDGPLPGDPAGLAGPDGDDTEVPATEGPEPEVIVPVETDPPPPPWKPVGAEEPGPPGGPDPANPAGVPPPAIPPGVPEPEPASPPGELAPAGAPDATAVPDPDTPVSPPIDEGASTAGAKLDRLTPPEGAGAA